MKIEKSLVLQFISLAVAFIVSATAFTGLMSYSSASKSILEKLTSFDVIKLVELKSEGINSRLKRAKESANVIAHSMPAIEFLKNRIKKPTFQETIFNSIQPFLYQFDYDFVSISSDYLKLNCYYNKSGKTGCFKLLKNDPAGNWYYSFVESNIYQRFSLDFNPEQKVTMLFLNTRIEDNHTLLGEMSLGMDISTIRNEFFLGDYYGGKSWLVDQDGIIRISENFDEIRQPIDTVLNSKIFLKMQNINNSITTFVEDNSEGQKFLFATKKINEENLFIIYKVNLEAMTKSISIIRITTLFTGIFSVLFASLAFYYFTNKITRPIRELTKITRQVADGNLNVRFDLPKPKNEVGLLIQSFDQMTVNLNESNNKLIEANINLEQKVKERTNALNETLSLIKQDLNFAKQIQKRLLPIDNVLIENLKITSRYIPMEEIGGDIFDITKIEDGIVRVFIADATGHGVQAALITMLIKSEYEGLKNVLDSPAKLLLMLNNIFYTKYKILNAFFSCFIVDINLKKETVCYASAGHPEQLLVTDNSIKVLEKTGTIIGVTYQPNFLEEVFQFRNKDRLLLFTDGIFEEFNNSLEEFGEKKISELIFENRHLEMHALIDQIMRNLNIFLNGNPIQDDITFIGIEIQSNPE